MLIYMKIYIFERGIVFFMRIVLMAGGKGTRLWPLSTDSLPKQFIPIFDNNQSMLTSTYNKIKELNCKIYVSTQREYADIALLQTNNSANIICEPFSHDTFAAFLNVAVYLKCEDNVDENEFVAIIPTDHDVDNNFYNILFKAEKLLQDSNKDFCLVGINPAYPSTQYGYILHEGSYVKQFVEKPDETKAKKLISENAAWNSGILVFKLGAMIKIAKKYSNDKNYKDFLNNYDLLPKISFDYEILEKMSDLMIVLSNKSWKDLGNWNTLYEKISMPDNFNTNIINTENKIIKNYGIEDSLIINSQNGIAMYPKLRNEIVRKDWGNYQLLKSYEFDNLVIEIKLLHVESKKSINCFENNHYIFCVITSGSGEIILNNQLKKLTIGSNYYINAKDKYTIKANKDLEIFSIVQKHKTDDKF